MKKIKRKIIPTFSFSFTGVSVQESVEQTLDYMLARVGGRGGAVAVTPSGELAKSFNTEGMVWSYIKQNKIAYGVYPGEETMLDFP